MSAKEVSGMNARAQSPIDIKTKLVIHKQFPPLKQYVQLSSDNELSLHSVGIICKYLLIIVLIFY